MELSIFNNLQLNGAELKWVNEWIAFEFSVQDFTVEVFGDNNCVKIKHVIYQGQTHTDPNYLAQWQTLADNVYNTIKSNGKVKETIYNNLRLNGIELKWFNQEFSFDFSIQDFIVRAFSNDGSAKIEYVIHQGKTYNDPTYLANWQMLVNHVFDTIKPVIDNYNGSRNKSIKKSLPESKSELSPLITMIVVVFAIAVVGLWWVAFGSSGMANQSPGINNTQNIDNTDYNDAVEIGWYSIAGDGHIPHISMSLWVVSNIVTTQLQELNFSDSAIENAINQIALRINFYDQAKWHATWYWGNGEITDPHHLRTRLVEIGYTQSEIEYAISYVTE